MWRRRSSFFLFLLRVTLSGRRWQKSKCLIARQVATRHERQIWPVVRYECVVTEAKSSHVIAEDYSRFACSVEVNLCFEALPLSSWPNSIDFQFRSMLTSNRHEQGRCNIPQNLAIRLVQNFRVGWASSEIVPLVAYLYKVTQTKELAQCALRQGAQQQSHTPF